MNDQLKQLKKDFEKGLKDVSDLLGLEELEQQFFGRKSGRMSEVMRQLKDMTDDARKEFGKVSNDVKKDLEALIGKKRDDLQRDAMKDIETTESLDVTQPTLGVREPGHLHPITQALKKLEEVARKMGFIIEDGPELESAFFIFDALNIPPHHPARDDQDTFYIKDKPEWTMRSHVSGMQVRQPVEHGVPLRAVHLGRVFRNEALDATHGHTFYQFDCIVIDKGLTMGDLVGVITTLLEGLYGHKVEVRIRPGYFPFVEPGFEFEMKMSVGAGEHKKEKWVEVVAGGLTHPNVIAAAGLDPKEYDGFAFSLGLDRLVMAKYGVEDIRHIHSGDLQFLKQF